ncbi:unnamed protein product [Spirodela intermedia]|uniref:Uncharacterized protein n=1 Tax=Spirodela intermedia TaxID=51605 RepID=A0ABN7EDG6_SPIIN|nr:unnamed protein product [Spirodela intermedia]
MSSFHEEETNSLAPLWTQGTLFFIMWIKNHPLIKVAAPSVSQIEDLLPSFSLKHVIGHFLGAQILTLSYQYILRYAPGTEQMVPGSGSNVISLTEDGSAVSTTCLPKKKTQNKSDDAPESLKDMTRLGESGSSSKLARTQKEEANKKAGFVVTSVDASGTGFPPCKPRKLFHDVFPSGNTAFHGGFPPYEPAYWPGGAFPYMNMYGAAQMLTFDPVKTSTQPYCIPYVSPVYGGLPLTWMGGFGAPMAAGAAQAASHGGVVEPFEGERRRAEQTAEDDDGRDNNSRDDLHQPSPRGRSSDSGGFFDEENARKRPTGVNLTAEKRSERERTKRRRRSSKETSGRSGGDRHRRDQRERDDASERRRRQRRRRRSHLESSPAPPEPPEKPEDDDRWQLVDGLNERYGPHYRRRRRRRRKQRRTQ